MKILHTGDWHIGPFPGPERDGLNLREQDTYICIERMISIAAQEKPDLAVVCGDVFHTAKVWSNRALAEARKAIEYIQRLSEICDVIVLYGTPNHDLPEQFEMLNDYFREFKGDRNVEIVTSPQRLIAYGKGETLQVCALPGFDRGVYRAKFPGLSREEENQAFTDEISNIILGLKAQCDDNSPTLLISHFTVPGCNMESGQTAFFSQAEPVITPETLSAANFGLVALGHIHRPQDVPGCRNTYYCGAVNAFNFNDEGQGRGFWIHELKPDYQFKRWETTASQFYKTPYREFLTMYMDEGGVTDFNRDKAIIYGGPKGGKGKIMGGCQDKIVRVLYDCADETAKALNKPLLEKALYDNGAFWVSEIVPAEIAETAVKDTYAEDTAPEDNLREYLTTRQYDAQKTAEIIEAARPIISEAVSGGTLARFTGVFEPVSIEVTNYRNYAEESFDFRGVTFCTINGANGAGKSSLFMDAIMDCLYEEPREGELTGWIRSAEDVRSGTIIFTFRIGDKTFRVTRTRAKKSGKATLNLSEFADGEWRDRSREKIRDTQDEIINILGMDSLTFKSCALIMQDQYGIFLQVDKEARMAVLANLLGLGVYEVMEETAKGRVSETNKEIAQGKTEIARLSECLSAKAGIEAELREITEELSGLAEEIKGMTADRDAAQFRLSTKLDAAERAKRIFAAITALNAKHNETYAARQSQFGIITGAEYVLSREKEILDGVAGYNALLEREKALLTAKAAYDTKKREWTSNAALFNSAKKAINALEFERAELWDRKLPLTSSLTTEDELRADSEKCAAAKQALEDMNDRAGWYVDYCRVIAEKEKTLGKAQAAFDVEYQRRIAVYNGYKDKAALLENSGCIDASAAACKFLADAQNAKAVMDGYLLECTAWKEAVTETLAAGQTAIDTLKLERGVLGYDADALKSQRSEVSRLEARHMEYEKLTVAKEQIKLIDERLAAIDAALPERKAEYAAAEATGNAILDAIPALKSAAEVYDGVITQIADNKKWPEEERRLPVAREQKATAEKRAAELTAELAGIAADIAAKTEEHYAESAASEGADALLSERDRLNQTIDAKQAAQNETSMRIGALKARLADIERNAAEARSHQENVNALSEKAAIYEELKAAFSQDGIPHNIIRSIIPLLTAKANAILGQMTGGRMGLEFQLDKVQKSSKKDVVTLDILIEEYSRGQLPYMSKSGGEKVKAALSAILALAEIKATRSGIQLGMLFIDEPPFLDGDGIQAYVDALEAIRRRYGSVKVMAITHDQSMKARFPQSVDVVKTESGSKVIVN